MNVEIKTIADMEAVLGKKLARNLLTTRRESMKAKPSSINFVESKPAYYLGDGDTLNAYAANIKTGELTGGHFCGSGDTMINHPEQTAEGFVPPKGAALIMVHSYWNGRNHSWTVTVVSQDLVKQVTEQRAEAREQAQMGYCDACEKISSECDCE